MKTTPASRGSSLETVPTGSVLRRENLVQVALALGVEVLSAEYGGGEVLRQRPDELGERLDVEGARRTGARARARPRGLALRGTGPKSRGAVGADPPGVERRYAGFGRKHCLEAARPGRPGE